jgi:hypothetical protein
MPRLSSTLRKLLKLWCAILGAWSLAAATPAAAQADPRWGFLAELAERDFEHSILISTWRWKVPNQILAQTTWGLGGHRVTEYELEPTSGTITVRQFYERRRSDFETVSGWKAGPDRLVTDKGKIIFTKSDTGGYGWGSFTFLPITPGHKREASVAKIIASGRLRPANPNLINSVQSAQLAAAVPTAQMAATAESLPAAPAVNLPAGPRLALVIGNSAYGASMGQLPNPANDAGAMAQALRALGFDVTVIKNADQKSMKRAISDFGQRLAKAGAGSTGLFFYAGHGIQAKGINYLIPTDANIQTQADVDLEAVGADTVLEQMEEAGAATNIVILDACRNMPLVRGFRSPTRGLAPMDAPNGSFIAYSTAPGSVAADGLGANSPFVTALVKNLGRKGESIESIFRDVRREVLIKTEGTQTPWDSSSLIQPFYFAGR